MNDVVSPAKPTERFTARANVHYEPNGLSLLRPYVRGKVPVIFIHGLGATPGRGSP